MLGHGTDSDSAYFSLAELRDSFRLVADDSTASRMVEIWKTFFGGYIVEERVVELPSDYGLPRVGKANDAACETESKRVDEYFDEMNSPMGSALIRFSDLTFTLLAGSSKEVRNRFERMGVPFAHRTLDDPVQWQQLLVFLRGADENGTIV